MFEKEVEDIDCVRSHHFLLIQAIELVSGTVIVSLLLWFSIILDPFVRWIYGTAASSLKAVSSEMKI